MVVQVRLLQDGDLGAVCGIVNHYIEHTYINFRTRLQTPAEWEQQWAAGRERYPWLVAVVDGEVAGLAYAGAYNPREAYAWTAESTIYLRPGLSRRGVGKALYGRLFELMDAQGFVSVTAGVSLPNEASVGIHQFFGFRPAGVLRSAGFKFGQWWDVGYFQRLNAVPDPPPELLPVSAVA